MTQEYNINNGVSGIAIPPPLPGEEDNYAVYWETPDLPGSPSTDEDGFRIAIDMLNFGAGEEGTYIINSITIYHTSIPE